MGAGVAKLYKEVVNGSAKRWPASLFAMRLHCREAVQEVSEHS
jgi:hypothetical protein